MSSWRQKETKKKPELTAADRGHVLSRGRWQASLVDVCHGKVQLSTFSTSCSWRSVTSRFNPDTSVQPEIWKRKNWLGSRINPMNQPHLTTRVRSISDCRHIPDTARCGNEDMDASSPTVLYAMRYTRHAAAYSVAGCVPSNPRTGCSFLAASHLLNPPH